MRRTWDGIRVLQPLTPGAAQVALDEAARGRVDFTVLCSFEQRFEAPSQLLSLVRVLPKLGVVQKRMEDAEVGVLELPGVKVVSSAQRRAGNAPLTPSESSPRL